MTKTLVWFNAIITDGRLWPDLLSGTKVLVAETGQRLAVGATWWIFDNKKLRQITSALAGPRLHSVLKLGSVHSNQDRCNAAFMPFLIKYRQTTGLDGLAAVEKGPGGSPKTPQFSRAQKGGKTAPKQVKKASGASKSGQKSTQKVETGVNLGCGQAGQTVGAKRPTNALRAKTARAHPAPQPGVPSSKGNIMNQSNTTKTGKSIVRQFVKVAGREQTIRFVAGPKQVIVSGKGLPKIIIAGTADAGFVAKCVPNPKKPTKVVETVGKTAELAFVRAVKTNWNH